MMPEPPAKADGLNTRMKAYEARESNRRFLPMLPVYARIDGRAFTAFTRGMQRPYDPAMTDAMIRTTEALVAETHALLGYTQSDEISLLWQAKRADGSIFFDHRVAKMTSVLASYATAAFIAALQTPVLQPYACRLPHFDCRVFELPTREEAAHAFLWREQDATKNAVSMAARAVYPHAALDHKSTAVMQDMLFAKGINFNDYPAAFKRGTFVRRETTRRCLTAEERARIPAAQRPEPAALVERTVMRRLDMPRFGSVRNRVAVVFDGAAPECELDEKIAVQQD